MTIRQIKAKDDEFIYNLIRSCLEDAQLNIPGTAYFDESIKKMSEFYLNKTGRNYFVITDQNDNALGGCGFAEFGIYDKSLLQKGNHIKVCELQKLYISKQARGKGLSYKLVSTIEQEAKNAGYHKIYLETPFCQTPFLAQNIPQWIIFSSKIYKIFFQRGSNRPSLQNFCKVFPLPHCLGGNFRVNPKIILAYYFLTDFIFYPLKPLKVF